MTTVFSFSDSSDGRIRSSSTDYVTARNGSSLDVDTTNTSFGTFGQARSGSLYTLYEYFARFSYVKDNDAIITSAYFRFTASITTGSPTRHAQVREYNWGTSLSSGDWADLSAIRNAPLLGEVRSIQNISNGQECRCGSDRLSDRLRTTGEVRVLLVNSHQDANNAPGQDRYNQFRTADFSGTSSDPALVYTTVPISTLDRYIGSQVQLSDGTHAFLEHDAVEYPNNTILVRHHNGTSVSTIATIDRDAFGSEDGRGMQAGTLVVDNDDNLYVIGRSGFTHNDISVWTYPKGGGHSWSSRSPQVGSLPSYGAPINNIVGAWNNVGSGGTIVCVVSHESGNNSGVEISYGLLNCRYLLTGSGSLLRDVGSAFGIQLTNNSSPVGYNNFQNETGTLMDIVASPGTPNRGFFTCTDRQHILGSNKRVYVSRYQLSSGGTSFDDVDGTLGSFAVKDAGAKSRVIGISSSQFVTVTADDSSGVGLSVVHRQNIGFSSGFSTLSSYSMASENIDSMPDASVLAVSPAWDVIYDPSSNSVWIYYFDVADANRLMKTHIDLTSGQAAQDEIEVDAAVGAGGSTNHAIRVHRGALVGDRVLISVANETSGGTHSTLYILDNVNAPPTQPTLTSRSNFDADVAATFEWTFNDPNAGDTQSAYQIQIDRTSDGVNVFDSGKTVSSSESHVLSSSTLTNDVDYRWRVKTWDSEDEESPWSGYGTFSTTDAGSVTIIDPVADNPPDQDVSSYEIEWEVSGTTQEEYRVRMYRNSNEDLLYDSDWVTSTDTTHVIDDIPSDTEVRFEVQVRSSGVASPPGTRLYTTSYATPPQPAVTADPQSGSGYILVTVSNPEPEGDVVQVEMNRILRRRTDMADSQYEILAEIGVDETFRDYSAVSRVEYEYLVIGIAFSGRINSEPVFATLRLRGVWIHNPKDPVGTIKHYPYGNASGGFEIVVEQSANHYAGRTYPVVDYGEQQDDTMTVAMQIIHGDPYYPSSGTLMALKQFAAIRQALTVRDGFGRGVVGSIEGWQETQVAPDVHNASFTVRQVDRVVETVEV